MNAGHRAWVLALWVGSLVLLPMSAMGQRSFEGVAGSVNDGWFVQSSARVTATGAEISTPGFSPTGWLKTSIPATPIGAQAENGVFPSPYVGKNSRKIPGWSYPLGDYMNDTWVAGSPYQPNWWFLNQFTIPSDLAGQRIYLHLDRINYRANLWVNGQEVATNTLLIGTYGIFEFDITSVANIGGANAVALDLTGPSDTDLSSDFVDWQWMPADRNEGILRSVWIAHSGPVKLRFPQVQTALNSALTSAALTVTAELTNNTASQVSGTLIGTINPGDITFSQPVTLSAGAANQIVAFSPNSFPQLTIASPLLWWPANLGAQNLYQTTLQLVVGSEVSDGATFHFGIRQISSGLNQKDSSGKQWRWFKINNQTIMIKAGGWAYDMLAKSSAQRANQELLLAKDLNLNAIRLEGTFEDEHFYDLADQIGIMIMADPVCCTQWENWSGWTAENKAVALASFDTQMRVLRNHPSVFLWMNGSDLKPPANIEKQEVAVEKKDNWPNLVISNSDRATSSVTGPTGVKEGVYDWEPPVFWYADTTSSGAFGFCTETSVGPEVPPMESLTAGLGANPAPWPINGLWNYHRGASRTFGNLNVVSNAINKRYGTATDAADYVRKSQAQNYESTRAMFEAYEANKSKTDGSQSTGVVQWQLNKGWPSLHWQLYDWYLRPGGGYFGAKKGGEFLHIQWDNAFQNSVHVINDSYKTYTGLVATADVLNFDLTSQYHNSVRLDAGPDSSNVAFTIHALPGLTTTYFVRLQLADSAGNVVSNNFYWYSTTPDKIARGCTGYPYCPTTQFANMTSLESLPLVTVGHSDSFARDLVTVTLTNNSTSLAFLIRTRVTDAGSEVLPVFWNDNYISLLPGESRVLTATFLPGSLPLSPAVQVDGFNVISD